MSNPRVTPNLSKFASTPSKTTPSKPTPSTQPTSKPISAPTPSRMPQAKFLSSAENLVYRSLVDCLTSKGIKKHGQFIISGERAVLETLEQWPAMVRNLVLPAVDAEQAQAAMFELPSKFKAAIDRALQQATPTTETSAPTSPESRADSRPESRPESRADTRRESGKTVGSAERMTALAFPPALFKELDVHGTHKPLLVMRTPTLEKADLKSVTPGLEIYCALGDPSNVGALIRSAAAFGAARVVLLQESASPFHPKATRAASAATLMLPLAIGPSIKDLASAAPHSDAPWVALDMEGQDIARFAWPKNARLIIGQEGQGLPKSTDFDYLMIPMQNQIDSLNATVASSIALFTWSQSRN